MIILIPFLTQLALIAPRFFDLNELYVWWEFLKPVASLLPLLICSLLALKVCQIAMQHWPSKSCFWVSGSIGFAWTVMTGVSLYFSLHLTDRYLYRAIVEPQRSAQGFPFEAFWDLPQSTPTINLGDLGVLIGMLSLIMIPCCVIAYAVLRKASAAADDLDA